MAVKPIILTPEGYKKLEEELRTLKVEGRTEIAEKIKEARSYGDLSENAEYDAAKDAQAAMEQRITTIENMLKNAQIVSDSDVSTDEISIGSRVKLYDVEFEEEMDNTPANIRKLTSFISAFCEKDKTMPFAPSGVAAVIEEASQMADDQTKLSARFTDLIQVLTEAAAWAKADKAELVTAEHVKKAMREKRNRVNNYDKRMQEMILDNTIMVDTTGKAVGQINGLSVLDLGDCMFGKPARITANTFIGKSGVVSIEREAHMSGTSHTKGALIISAYLGEKYAQDLPLALTASLCFEQLYSGVDGDSASSTEIYAILSSLSDAPINQGIAVTGSVNQKGEIQPIGGATHKIEGFFDVCKSRKLTGEQGVIIPIQNVKNLHLKDEVIEAVKEGKFHIWPVKSIDEGIEILTGVPAGKKKKDGSYPKGSINQLVYDKLRKYALTVTNFGKEEAGTMKY